MAGWARARIASLLVAGMLAGGCSADAENPESLPRHADIGALVAAVAERQRIDSTARLSLRGEITGDTVALRFTGTGVLRVLADGVSVKFSQVVTQRDVPPVETGFVLLPDATYLRLSTEAGGDPDKPWVLVDPDATEGEAGELATMAATLADSADPTKTLTRYPEATFVADTADDVIDGDAAVRYTIVVDLQRAAEAAADPGVAARLEQQVAAGLRQLTSTLWLDALDRPVRSAVDQELPGIGNLTITGSYRDWGQAVRIDPPPAARVR